MREKLKLFMGRASDIVELFIDLALIVLATSFVSVIVTVLHFGVLAGFAFFVASTSICILLFLYKRKH